MLGVTLFLTNWLFHILKYYSPNLTHSREHPKETWNKRILKFINYSLSFGLLKTFYFSPTKFEIKIHSFLRIEKSLWIVSSKLGITNKYTVIFLNIIILMALFLLTWFLLASKIKFEFKKIIIVKYWMS